MKTLAKLLSYLMPVKKYRKPFLKRLENLLWCGDYRNPYVSKIRRTAKKTGRNLYVAGPSKVNRNTTLGDNVRFHGMKITGKGRVDIGSYVIAAGDCMIITQNHNYEGDAIPYDDTLNFRDVVIGDFVWIGARVLILPENRRRGDYSGRCRRARRDTAVCDCRRKPRKSFQIP